MGGIMMNKKKYERYSLKQIKAMFSIHRKNDGNEVWSITENEFRILCEAIQKVPKKYVDQILDEVYIVVLSLRKKRKIHPGCHLLLNSKDLETKKGVIFYSPQIFSSKSEELFPTFPILHEIAHHIKGHKDPKNSKERKKFEDEANELVIDWLTR